MKPDDWRLKDEPPEEIRRLLAESMEEFGVFMQRTLEPLTPKQLADIQEDDDGPQES